MLGFFGICKVDFHNTVLVKIDIFWLYLMITKILITSKFDPIVKGFVGYLTA